MLQTHSKESPQVGLQKGDFDSGLQKMSEKGCLKDEHMFNSQVLTISRSNREWRKMGLDSSP